MCGLYKKKKKKRIFQQRITYKFYVIKLNFNRVEGWKWYILCSISTITVGGSILLSALIIFLSRIFYLCMFFILPLFIENLLLYDFVSDSSTSWTERFFFLVVMYTPFWRFRNKRDKGWNFFFFLVEIWTSDLVYIMHCPYKLS